MEQPTNTDGGLPALTTRARAALNPDGIPDELKARPQWVCWRYASRLNGTTTKPPINPATGQLAKSNDPTTWATFDKALARFQSDQRMAGIGMMLGEDDDLIFVDIDDRGAIQDELAGKALTWFAGTYAETSPAGGFGAHIVTRGQLPGKHGTKQGIFEAYTHPSSRYLTFTGQRLVGHSEAVTAQQEALGYLHTYCLTKQPEPPEDWIGGDCLTTTCPNCGAAAEYPDCEACGYDLTAAAAATSPEPTDRTDTGERPPVPSSVSVGFDPADRLQKALLNNEIRALYAGDVGRHGDRSRAELALCLRLMTFADGDEQTVADWMDGSGCGKWLERNRDTDGYRASTLAAAAAKWDGKPFVDKAESGRALMERLLRNRRDKAGHSQTSARQPEMSGVSGSGREPGEDDEPAGHSQPDTGQPGVSGSEPPVKKPLFVDAANLLATLQPPKWLVKKWIAADSLTTLFGAPGSGKSFIAIDMACCVAAGQWWNEHRTATGQVLYIAGEGHVGFARRLTAWQAERGAIPANRLFVSVRTITLDAGGAAEVLRAIEELSEVPLLIIVDTLATTIAGNENDAADMATFIRALKLFQESTQAAIVVVHHTGHGDKTRARGHSSLNGAIDTELKVEKVEGAGTIACSKMKDAEPPATVGFTLKTVALGLDEDDDPITSCTVEYGQPGSSEAKQRKPPASQVIALRALHTALINEGGTYNGQFGVHIEAWRKAAYDGGIADTPEGKQRAFFRARTTLVAIGDAKCNEDIYWFADTGKQNSASLLNTEKRKQKETQVDY